MLPLTSLRDGLMLAVGFEQDVETSLEKLPPQRQSMLFSTTMARSVQKLSRKYLKTPLTIDLVGDQDEKLAEGMKVYAIPTTSTTLNCLNDARIRLLLQRRQTRNIEQNPFPFTSYSMAPS